MRKGRGEARWSLPGNTASARFSNTPEKALHVFGPVLLSSKFTKSLLAYRLLCPAELWTSTKADLKSERLKTLAARCCTSQANRDNLKINVNNLQSFPNISLPVCTRHGVLESGVPCSSLFCSERLKAA